MVMHSLMHLMGLNHQIWQCCTHCHIAQVYNVHCIQYIHTIYIIPTGGAAKILLCFTILRDFLHVILHDEQIEQSCTDEDAEIVCSI